MLNEYWINVYATGYGDLKHSSYEEAKYYSILASSYRKLIYRIHVKMKKEIYF